MKTASIIGIFLINVFMSKGLRRDPLWDRRVRGGPDGRHPALGCGPVRRHPALGCVPGRHPTLGCVPVRRHPALGCVPVRKGKEEGMLITGGSNFSCNSVSGFFGLVSFSTQRPQNMKSVEAYNPYIPKICKLSDLPNVRRDHTICGGLLCSEKSCLKLGPSGFVKTTVSLQQHRTYHLCWNVREGVLLLGGESSPSTTELVQVDGSSSVSNFDLSYPAR